MSDATASRYDDPVEDPVAMWGAAQEAGKSTEPTPIPFADGWAIVDEGMVNGTHQFELASNAGPILVVEFSLVNTLVTPPTAAVSFWLPGENEPYRERHVVLGDSRALRSLVLAWKQATDGATSSAPLLPILRHLADRVLLDSEGIAGSLNLSTAEVTDETRRLMFEPLLIDEQLTAWFSQPGIGKSKLLVAVAADISHRGDSFLGFNYAGWRPFLLLDWEEVGVAGENAFVSQLDAVCRGAGIERADTAVHYLQPKTTFARSLPQLIAERDRLTELYGTVPITGIDSVTRAMGGNSLSMDAWASFENAWRIYGTTTIAADHETKSASGGIIQGPSPKTAGYRHSVYLTRQGSLLALASKKSNRVGEQMIATFHVRVDRDDGGLVRSVEYRQSLTAAEVAEAKGGALTAKTMLLAWARLTDEPITVSSLGSSEALAVFEQPPPQSARNKLTELAGGGLFERVGTGMPKQYRLTSDGLEAAVEALVANPEIQKRYDELTAGGER